jgi:hypothetical protein
MLQTWMADPFSILLISLLSMLVCPLCGRLCSVRHFDPNGFEDDIFIQQVKGLGQGKGFRTTEVRSVFESDRSAEVEEAISKIYGRVLEILAMLLSNDLVTRGDVARRLGLGSDLPVEVLTFLRLETVEEFLYDADAETQQRALRLRRLALDESEGSFVGTSFENSLGS